MRRKKEIDRPSSLSVVSAADEAISARWRYVFKNWYEIPGMIRIVVFALIGQGSNIYDGFITVGVMLRFLAILYLIKLSRSVEDKSRILGGQVVLQIFIIFFLTLVILSLAFYSAEHSAPNSEITNIGDALWWTIQTASTATFGPNAVTAEGRIVGYTVYDSLYQIRINTRRFI